MVQKSEVWGVVLEDIKSKQRLKPISVVADNFIVAVDKAKGGLFPPEARENYRVVKVERLVDIIV